MPCQGRAQQRAIEYRVIFNIGNHMEAATLLSPLLAEAQFLKKGKPELITFLALGLPFLPQYLTSCYFPFNA